MMKQQVIENNNELIAIFEGWELMEEDRVQWFRRDGYRQYHYELQYNTN